MDKLIRSFPIPGLNEPTRLREIVLKNDPQHQIRLPMNWPPETTAETEENLVRVDELKTACKAMKNKTAPGKDGIPNEVIRI